jgi:hypothetical protein
MSLLKSAKGLVLTLVASAMLVGSFALPASAGHIRGPRRVVDTVFGHSDMVYNVEPFVGRQPTTIAVVGDGSTNLDLFVYDQFGNLIAADTNAGDDCTVEFTPRWTGPFSVVVRNHGDTANNYLLVTN